MERDIILTMRLPLFLSFNTKGFPFLSQHLSEPSSYRTTGNTRTVLIVNSLIIVGEMNTQSFFKILTNIFEFELSPYKRKKAFIIKIQT